MRLEHVVFAVACLFAVACASEDTRETSVSTSSSQGVDSGQADPEDPAQTGPDNLLAGESPPAVRSQASDEPPPPSGLLEDERNTIDIFRRVSSAVVFITSKERRQDMFTLNILEIPVGSGSGFVWDRNGHIVTNFHVVASERGDQSRLFSVTLADGSVHDAEVVGTEPNKDLAVLRIAAPSSALSPIQPGDSDHLLVGQKVLAIGNPFGLDQTLTTGVISALGREIKSMTGTNIHDVIQTDASINPGNSGGPLLDSAGRLIGVNTSIISQVGQSAGIGFAVPVNTVMQIVPQLIQYGGVKRAGFGVVVVPENRARAWGLRSGVAVMNVSQGSAADVAGIQPARRDRGGYIYLDVIVGIDGEPIENYGDMVDALDRHEPGDKVKVKLVREGRELVVDVVLQEIGP